MDEPRGPLTRRRLLQAAAMLGVAAPSLRTLEAAALAPDRGDVSRSPQGLPDIQFAIDDYIPEARRVDGVLVRFPPVWTSFNTFALTRTPTPADQAVLARALDAVEAAYAFSATGVFTTIAYGTPYFERLPGGIAGDLVSGHLPRILEAPARYAFEEAVAGPTDVGGPPNDVVKATFNVPVAIESNDVVVMLRSDSSRNLADVLAFLTGSSTQLGGREVGASGLAGLLVNTSSRLMFVQQGLPRSIADGDELAYATRINPDSPMWMGFADHQTSGTGPPEIVTFQGNDSARLTTAQPGDYFDNGSVLHLSHVILDLEHYYGPTQSYSERVQGMFRSNPAPASGSADQFTDGGGPAFLENTFQGSRDAVESAVATGRLGHLSTVQRNSRASDGTPMHIRADGPGFDSLDVPDGSAQPKLQFAIFVPTAEFFRIMRKHQASPDIERTYAIDPAHSGIERFLTATRRQNYLVPPRRHRAFPLVELVPPTGSAPSAPVAAGVVPTAPLPTAPVAPAPVAATTGWTVRETFPAHVERGHRASGVVSVERTGAAGRACGPVVVRLEGGRVVGRGRLARGRARITLKQLPPGRHALVIRWDGDAQGRQAVRRFVITQR